MIVTEAGVKIGTGRDVDCSYEEALSRAEEALKREGFGILTRVDVRATMREKIGQELPPFTILGACNPLLAHRALMLQPEVGLLLPCNVVVRRLPSGKTRIEAIHATAIASIFANSELATVTHEVSERLSRVVASL